MHGKNLDLFITENSLFVLRNKLLYKYTHDYDLVETIPSYIKIKEINSVYYSYDGSDFYQSTDLINYTKICQESHVSDFYIYDNVLHFIHAISTNLYYNELEINSYYWYDKYLYYSCKNGLFRVDLISGESECLTTVNPTCICVSNNLLIYSRLGQIYIDSPKGNRIIHKHDSTIKSLYIDGRNLYVVTEDFKMSIMDIYKDNVRYISEFLSETQRITRNDNYIYILNEYELIKYNIEEGKDVIYYNLPGNNFLEIYESDIEQNVLLEPVFSTDQIFDHLIIYKDLVYVTNKEEISKIYRIKKSTLFYTGQSICAVFRNRIEVYKFTKNGLAFVKRLTTIKEKIDQIIEKDDMFYFVSGNNLIKNDIINLTVDTDFRMSQ